MKGGRACLTGGGSPSDVGKVWTSDQLAKAGGVNRSRIRQLCIEGRFAGAFKFGHSWAIPDAAARRWLDEDRDRRFTRDWDEDEEDQPQSLAALARRFVGRRRGHDEE